MPVTLKYVDNNLQLNKVNMDTAAVGRDGEARFKDKHGIACQNTYRRVIRRAEECGMKVNGAKTTMICVSGTQSYQARSHIFGADGDIVRSEPSMKVLGYHLSSRPGAHAQVEALCKKIRRKYWVLFFLAFPSALTLGT